MTPLLPRIIKNYTLKSWDDWTGDEVQSEQLWEDSEEYKRIARKVGETLHVVIDYIERVQNPFLWGFYLLKKAEYKNFFSGPIQQDLFHCTAPKNIDSIVTNNLDWRRSSRTKFGRGVSFSPSAAYANLQANKNIGKARALIYAKVLVGKKCGGHENMMVPPAKFDTSTGNGGDVIVKYCDNEFYPQYVIYYDTPKIRYSSKGRFYV